MWHGGAVDTQPGDSKKVAGWSLHGFFFFLIFFLQFCTPVVSLAEIIQIGHPFRPETRVFPTPQSLDESVVFPGYRGLW